ncbi:helix-turn-helix transcriptional regulator [Streptomyces sp. NPDC046215]|uniref:Helix-turn-helix transcriptional regulator n=1 Tax=Streptomyces stramineus TaxID=173861 RepID=A0ABN1B795_9ACTN
MPGQKKLQPGLSLAALYGKKVRKLRTQAGWTQRELGGKVYVSHSRIARIELGTESLPRQLSDALDKVLGADGDLSDLWEHIGYPLRFPSWSTPFFEAETKATRMHKFSHMMPGLTQTEGYMRALFGPYDIYSGLTTEEKVSTRLGRQAILDSATPPWLWIILDEAVLYRIVGGQEVMRGQLTQLLALTERPRFHLQILPYASSEPCTVGGSMTLLTLPHKGQLLYLDGIGAGGLIDDPEKIEMYACAYDRMQANALAPVPTKEYIRKVMEERYPSGD